MAGAGVGFVLALVAAVLVQDAAAQKVHVVGDATGWNIPDTPTFYSEWAAKNKFAVGDSLTFKFGANLHDVLEVTKESFEACGSEDDALDKVITTSPATVKLTKPGTLYFMCTVGKHCLGGQKLAVTVGGAGAGAAANADAASPSPNASSADATAPSQDSAAATAPSQDSAAATAPSHDSAAAGAPDKSPSSSSETGGAAGSDELAPAPASSASALMGSVFVTLSAIVMSLF